MPEHWCTVTVTDAAGRRHSLDVIATSTYDAAHLYVTNAKAQPQTGLPVPTLASVFEVVNGGKVYSVEGTERPVIQPAANIALTRLRLKPLRESAGASLQEIGDSSDRIPRQQALPTLALPAVSGSQRRGPDFA
jgi:hypothetical protein